MWRINYAFVPGSERVPFLGAGRLARRRARRASSRKYSEMRLADLSGAGDAIRELKLGIEQKCACGALYGATWGSIVSARQPCWQREETQRPAPWRFFIDAGFLPAGSLNDVLPRAGTMDNSRTRIRRSIRVPSFRFPTNNTLH
jgi:hypothetical protein